MACCLGEVGKAGAPPHPQGAAAAYGPVGQAWAGQGGGCGQACGRGAEDWPLSALPSGLAGSLAWQAGWKMEWGLCQSGVGGLGEQRRDVLLGATFPGGTDSAGQV